MTNKQFIIAKTKQPKTTLSTSAYKKFSVIQLYSCSIFLLLNVETSALLIAILLCGLITFFWGIAYGMYLKDRLIERNK